jgi:hypothetical protein
MGNLEAAIINMAGTQLGVRETTGHNDGPAVESYLQTVGLGKGYSWCMAFVYWCSKSAAALIHQQNPLKQTGGVLDEWDSGRGIHITTPEPGCIMIMDHGSGQGHTGIVTGVFLDKGYIHTIEGNTNEAGSREGVGVFRKTRMLKGDKIIGYIKLADVPL